jgi:23S rRNA pseudouridine1911/1915/1917 synthase
VRLGYAPSRRAAAELISHGRVRVNGRRFRKGGSIAVGDSVEVADAPAGRAIEPNPDLKIAILFEDAGVIIADKPSLMPCHPLRSEERATVMNAIVAAYPETAYAGDKPLEGGLVHRLDNGTSGALIIARNREAFVAMRDALRDGRVTRHYRALVAGRLDGAIEIATPIAHHPKNQRKMVVVDQAVAPNAKGFSGGIDNPPYSSIRPVTDRGGDKFDLTKRSLIPAFPTSAPGTSRYRSSPRPALTRVEVLSYKSGFTLVQVTPRTGSRHQIRVHLASIGHPLAGDDLYGGPPLEGLSTGRFWLHLAELEFDSPAGGRVRVTAPLTRDLEDSLAHLRSGSTTVASPSMLR